MFMKNKRILLVDDEPDVLDFLSYNLKKEGAEVFTASNGKDAIEKAKEVLPDLIVLDVMMPVMDGIEACTELRKIRETKEALILFLTARTEDYSQIAGLEAGVDDYISKPINPRVLISRLKALLRGKARHKIEQDKEVIDIGGGVKINKESYSVTVGGKEITLPKKEFELISLLGSKPGKVFSREEILTKVWGDDVVIGDRTIDVHVRKLRQKIGDDRIMTLKGIGYKYEI